MRNIQMAKGRAARWSTAVPTYNREKHVLIVTEPSQHEPLRRSLARGGLRCGRRAGLSQRSCPASGMGRSRQPPIAAAMKAAEVFLCVVGKSITHTQAVKEAVAQRRRAGLVLTHFTEEMLVRGGIEADFPAIAPTCRAIAQALQNAQDGPPDQPHTAPT